MVESVKDEEDPGVWKSFEDLAGVLGGPPSAIIFSGEAKALKEFGVSLASLMRRERGMSGVRKDMVWRSPGI